MRYLAALLSILLHISAMFILADFVVPVHDQVDPFEIQLIDLPKDLQPFKKDFSSFDSVKKKNTHRPEGKKDLSRTELKPKLRADKIKRLKPHKPASHKPDQSSKVQAESEHLQDERITRPAKNYPHIEIGSSKSPDAVVLRQGKGITVGNSTMVLKRGSEARSLSALAAYEFDENDFRGHYETFTGRQVVIIDGRAEHGRLILYDRQSGLIRKLKKTEYGDFIYTYGPSFDEDEPVKGSVVFLPGDEHWIHRFMWMPDGAPAEYPVKGRVDAVAGGKEQERCDLFVPALEGRYPAVILVPYGIDIPSEEFAEVARHLCGKGIVVFCPDNFSPAELRRGYDKLRQNPKVDPARIGVWARGYGAKKMPRMDLPAGLFKFVILTIDHPDEGLFPERLASVLADTLPTFIGFRGVGSDWKRVVPVMLTGFQSAPHQIVMIDATPSVGEGVGTDQEWIDCLSGDFVSSISAWLDSN
ncbi:hypothetical protein [Maridesulfovibrio sp.]|uniref:dienelactone hydrolase family protein n=1 Tax=Maridesulfovibrio sp. TaxID=2795000 RepID=UPI002AA628DF|nr:hypothetical protein [Maridesulfovibrio sp.]